MDPILLRSFINLRLGQPFEERGEGIKYQEAMVLRSNYQRGTIPEGVLLTTLGVDVQKEPARLEMELLGHGLDRRKWSIDYYTIFGDTNDADSGAFLKLREKIIKKDFPAMPINIFIDAGYNTGVVYDFCQGAKGIHPSMGIGYIKGKLVKPVKVPSHGIILHELNTDVYKEQVYNAMRLRKNEQGRKPYGFLEFPFDYDAKYFKGLTSEIRKEKSIAGRKSYVWMKRSSSSRNEPLDVRVYAMAAFDSLVETVCKLLELEETDIDIFWKYAMKNFDIIGG